MNTKIGNSLDRMPACLGGLPAFNPEELCYPKRNDVIESIQQAIQNDCIRHYNGKLTEQLQSIIKEQLGIPFVKLCSSGSVGIQLALQALKIGAGDRVVLAAYDFKGNFVNVLQLGAKPLLVDLEQDRLTINLGQLERAIEEPDVKAVIVSHMHGDLAPMQQIRTICERQSIRIIEDACQVPGATVDGKPAGTWGDFGVFSFGGGKLLASGRGGAIVSSSEKLFGRLKLIGFRGPDVSYPLSELQAAALIPQWNTLHQDHVARASIARYLLESLQSIDGLMPVLCSYQADSPGYYKLAAFYDADQWERMDRTQWIAAMQAEGIPVHAGFPALHLSHAKSRYETLDNLQNAERVHREVVKFHHSILYDGKESIDRIIESIQNLRKYLHEIKEASLEPIASDLEDGS